MDHITGDAGYRMEIEDGSVLMILGESGPLFFLVSHILSAERVGFFLFLEKISTQYVEHFDSYEVLKIFNNTL